MSRKNLYIIGARGFGRECVGHFRSWSGFMDQYVLAGFLDDKQDALLGYDGYPKIVGDVESFIPREGDVFVCALGAVEYRRKYVGILASRGGVFPNFISPVANVHQTARLGLGVMILDNCLVSSDVRVGNNVLCNVNVVLGHDTVVGDDSVLESFVFCGGFSEIGSGATLHTRSTILPHKKVGENAVVGVCSCPMFNVKPTTFVYGNPALPINQ